MKISKFKSLIALSFMAFFMMLTSCSDSNDGSDLYGNTPMQTVALTATTTFDQGVAKGTSARSEITLTQFLVNIKEIELEIDDDFYDDDDDDDNDDDSDDNDDIDDDSEDWDDDGYYSSDDEIELRGPFTLDLLSGEFTFAVTELPQAPFEEIEFEFDINEDPESPLFGNTVLIEGTLDGTPFIFTYDFEEEVEVDFEDANQDILISSSNNDIIINFDLNSVLYGANSPDLSMAVDGDGDGVIEIGRNDDDGNDAIAQQLKELLKDYAELLDD